MSDTTTCSQCGTEVPAAAAFCTGCGQPLRAAAPPPPVDPTVDPTRVETAGLNDATQVAPPPPPPTSAPWSPPAPGAAQPPVPPPAPPSWQQPVAPPGAATFTPAAPPASGPAWGTPAPQAGAPVWGQQAPEREAPSRRGSVLGGLVGVIGSVLAIVGIFSGWVKLGSTGTVTAWSLTEGDGLIKTQTPLVILALAGFALAFSLALFTGLARTPVRIITALLGIAIVGVTAANWAQIAAFITDTFPPSFEATTAIGFYLTIAGGVLVLIASLLPAKK
ncbi:MAG: hypothetical protein JWO77_2646 [Ilumatobacteraceae bacterium]|nr:hypothetical protein [Ilumatobacteraceae bacterium]